MLKKIKLEELIDVKRGASLPGENYSTEGKLIRLTLGNFDYPNGGFKDNTSKLDIFFVGDIKEEFILSKGDIITPLTEQVAGLLGETATIPEDNKYIQSGDIGLIKVKPGTDKRYIYYLLSSNTVKKQLGAAAQQTKIRHTSPEKIKECTVFVLPFNEQIKVGRFLDLINKKISNNNKINDNLQQTLQTIYDYWFSQFDFPDENGKPYKSSGGKMVWNDVFGKEIPDGWKTCEIGDLLKVKLGGTPSTNHQEYWGGDIPWLSSGEVNAYPIMDSEKTITQEGMENSSTSFTTKGSILISITGYINVGYLNIDACFNQSVVAVEPSNLVRASYLYPFFLTKVNHYMMIRTGAVQPHINKDVIEKTIILLPKDDVLEEYYKVVDSIHKTIVNNGEESNNLVKLRDWLFPMLMNGQATIED